MPQDQLGRNVDAQAGWVHLYERRDLEPPERHLLRLLADRWADASMLDVGVGAGRTAYTFAALARRYVGVDVAPEMIAACRRALPESDGAEFLVGDVQRLSELFDERFDIVLFSFNGIDYLDPSGRSRALTQMRDLVAPDGYLMFSSHSLPHLPFRPERPSLRPRTWRRAARTALRALIGNRIDLDATRRRGWGLVRDGAHNWRSRFMYVEPAWQVAELERLGLEVIALYGVDGRELARAGAQGDPWVHYLCRPRRG